PRAGMERMMCPPPPAAEPGSLPKDFRQSATGIGATRQQVTVVAGRRGQRVARFEQGYQRDTGRLLSNIEVIVADELLLVREPQHGFLKPAYQQHLFEMFPGEFFVQGHGDASRSKLTASRARGTDAAPGHAGSLAKRSRENRFARRNRTAGVALGAVTRHAARVSAASPGLGYDRWVNGSRALESAMPPRVGPAGSADRGHFAGARSGQLG